MAIVKNRQRILLVPMTSLLGTVSAVSLSTDLNFSPIDYYEIIFKNLYIYDINFPSSGICFAPADLGGVLRGNEGGMRKG
ncbi:MULTISPECIES: hypothetical protein [Burkholderia]|uniref:hypothetical protein n=1 Tax=Burkholderia TaxID=32008 RepID=UPI0015A65D6D|nr:MULTISPECIES: hypothetical protein [Burkholderia]